MASVPLVGTHVASGGYGAGAYGSDPFSVGTARPAARPALDVEVRDVPSPSISASRAPRHYAPSAASRLREDVAPRARLRPAVYAAPTSRSGSLRAVYIGERFRNEDIPVEDARGRARVARHARHAADLDPEALGGSDRPGYVERGDDHPRGSRLRGRNRFAEASQPRAGVVERVRELAGSASVGSLVGVVAGHKVAACVVGFVLVAVTQLYSPVKVYYTAMRSNSYMAADVNDVNGANTELKSSVDSLMTPEGIMDEARKLGYVAKGETAVDMAGVDDGESSATAASATASADESQPWYVHVLDALFQYDQSSQGVS